jgi:hypothetical protein
LSSSHTPANAANGPSCFVRSKSMTLPETYETSSYELHGLFVDKQAKVAAHHSRRFTTSGANQADRNSRELNLVAHVSLPRNV